MTTIDPLHDVAAAPPRRPWLHPASAILILGVDWLFFGAEVLSLETAVVLASLAAFATTTLGVFWIQRARSADSRTAAAAKALFAGVVAGIPTSIGGTVLGTFVLALAGLSRWKRLRRLPRA
jgi:hypothetical protein